MPRRKKSLDIEAPQSNKTGDGNGEETFQHAESLEVAEKPKRKYVRKKKVENEEPQVSEVEASVEETKEEHIFEEAKPEIENESALIEEPSDEIEVPRPAAHTLDGAHIRNNNFRDIRPRHLPDADFLAPENPGFNALREQTAKRASNAKWVQTLLYSIGTLIIVAALGLFAFSVYTARQVTDSNPTDTEVTGNQDPKEEALKLGIISSNPDVAQNLSQELQTQFGDTYELSSSSTSNLPKATVDTLYLKDTAEAKAEDLLTALSQAGIKATIAVNNVMEDDIAIYLVDTLTAPDLGGQTAIVENASGVAGVARKNCDLLEKYKATSCEAANATTEQDGLMVQYKEISTYFVLARTTEFKDATFAEAPDGLEQDIRVVVGE